MKQDANNEKKKQVTLVLKKQQRRRFVVVFLVVVSLMFLIQNEHIPDPPLSGPEAQRLHLKNLEEGKERAKHREEGFRVRNLNAKKKNMDEHPHYSPDPLDFRASASFLGSCSCCDTCHWCSKCVHQAVLHHRHANNHSHVEDSCNSDDDAESTNGGVGVGGDCDCDQKLIFSAPGIGCQYKKILNSCEASVKQHASVGRDLTIHALESGPKLVCYSSGDLVCHTLGQVGTWESTLLETLNNALSELTYLEVKRLYARGGGPGGVPRNITRYTRIPSEVEAKIKRRISLIDVGANVGAFSFAVWSAGYQVQAVEGFPPNVQLLRLSQCLNGFEVAYNTSQSLAHFHAAPAEIHRLSIHHAVLGRSEAQGQQQRRWCVMVSEDANFGDVHVTCNQALVQKVRAREQRGEEGGLVDLGGRQYRSRGSVQLTSLDALVHQWWKLPLSASSKLQHYQEQMHEEKEQEEEDWSGGVPRHSIMKIDVEGNEGEVLAGSEGLLAHPTLRPKLILTEVWHSKNATALVEQLFAAKYRLWIAERKAWVDGMVNYQLHLQTHKADIDTYIFVLPEYESIFRRGHRGPRWPLGLKR